MSLETLEQQLASVQKSISDIETGSQEYRFAAGGVTRADLATLYKREADLLARINIEKHGTRTLAGWKNE